MYFNLNSFEKKTNQTNQNKHDNSIYMDSLEKERKNGNFDYVFLYFTLVVVVVVFVNSTWIRGVKFIQKFIRFSFDVIFFQREKVLYEKKVMMIDASS